MDRLPPVGSDAYGKLGYQDKLFILNLYLFDKDKYKLLVEYGDTATGFFVEQQITHLLNTGKFGVPPEKEDSIVSVETGYWGVYFCRYDPKYFVRAGIDPLGEFDIGYERTLGVNLFSFPVLRTDFVGSEILKWIFECKNHSVARDPVFNLMAMRMASELLIPNVHDRVHIAKRAGTKKRLNESRNDPRLIRQQMTPVTIDDVDIVSRAFVKQLGADERFDYSTSSLTEMFDPLFQPSQLFEDIETEQMVLVFNKCKRFGKWWYAPIVPVELYLDQGFTVRDWSFLYSSSNGKKKHG